MATDKPLLRISPVESYVEGFAVALIRNECRQWMTNDQTILNVERQIAFVKGLRDMYDDRGNGYRLFLAKLDGMPCGFGVVKVEGRKACITGGLAEPFRGKGHGRRLFRELTYYADAKWKPWLTVFRDNLRAISIYTSLGYHITKATKRIYTMEYRP